MDTTGALMVLGYIIIQALLMVLIARVLFKKA